MLPAFVMTNVTDPAAILACDSATLHSDSFTLTCEAPSGRDCGAAPIIAPSRAMVVELRFMAASSSRGVVWCPPVGPRASPLYSLGNIQVTCGVSIRQVDRAPRGPVGVERAGAIRSRRAAASGRRVHAGALPHAERPRCAGCGTGRFPARAAVFPELPRGREWRGAGVAARDRSQHGVHLAAAAPGGRARHGV